MIMLLDTSKTAQFRRKFESVMKPSDIGALFTPEDLVLLAGKIHPSDLDLNSGNVSTLIERFMPEFAAASSQGLFRREVFYIETPQRKSLQEQTFTAIFNFACDQGILEVVNLEHSTWYRIDPIVGAQVNKIFAKQEGVNTPA